MSTLVVSYKDLEDMVKNAGKAAALLEEYADTIEDKVCRKLKEYSGNWTSNIDMADQLMKGKVERLRQKKEDFETLASNIETFKNNCKTADNNVKSAIQSLSGDFKNTYGIKENVVTKWFNYIGTDLVNSNALGRYLKDITNSVNINTRHAAEVIKDWYKYDDGKYIVDLLELYMKQKIDHGLSILRQVALGSFTDDVTLEGTVLQIALGFTGFDLPCDIRDIIGDIYNLREPGQSKLPLLLDLISILPIVGALKYTDEIGTVLKNGLKQTDEAVTFIKKGLKNGDEIVDNAGKGIKGGLNAVDDIAAQGKKVLDNFDIDSAYVKPKHLATSGGNGAKFLGDTKEAAEVILQDAIKNGTIVEILDDGVSALGNKKYSILIDAGKEIGTKGEHFIKIIISDDGGMLSAYPVKY
ncbi:hypothetical protein EDD66_101394 [Mobilisporobacter senegalensis]|uniref:Uncharacterized protein n=1 Tax=Mobilisporobacter senegalensis TaxID=1329262 RepID=A0A3N1XYU1_9FIRM|nr:hypothetical protein [Mobilisporobacter senegalensis]ROR31776.1 hypothetical protein EDD66_101394 [Mobilisporobacter senegalensis]